MIGLATLSKRIERLEPVPDPQPDIVGVVLSSLSDAQIDLPMGMRTFQVHVERWWIGGADPFKYSLAAPEFHAALEVRVEDPL